MIDADDALLDHIYECAFIPDGWPSVLQTLSMRTNSLGGVIFAVDVLKRGGWVASPNLVDIMHIVVTDFADRNIRPGKALAKQYAGFMADREFMTVDEREKEPMYTDLLRPNGLEWACGSVVPMPSGDLLILDFERRLQDGPFERSTLALLDSYRPHIARAGILAARLQFERSRAVTNLLETLSLPGAVLTASGRVVAMNALLQDRKAQISIGAFDYLRLTHKPSQDLLSSSLHEIGTSGQQKTIRSIPVPASDDQSSFVAHIVPIRRQAHDIFGTASALFLATPLCAPAAPSAGLLCGLFDLTPAEDRVARAMADGHSIESLASLLSLSPETIRSQLKAVMMKTGTSRQTELVRLLAGATTVAIGNNAGTS